MSLRDIDPEGIVRHEDIQGIKTIEQYYLQSEAKNAARQRAKNRHQANKK